MFWKWRVFSSGPPPWTLLAVSGRLSGSSSGLGARHRCVRHLGRHGDWASPGTHPWPGREAVAVTAEFVQLLECKNHRPGQLPSPVPTGVAPGGPEGPPGVEVKETINLSPFERLRGWKWDPSHQPTAFKTHLSTFVFREMPWGLGRDKEWTDGFTGEVAEAGPEPLLHTLPGLCPDPRTLGPRFQAAQTQCHPLLGSP